MSDRKPGIRRTPTAGTPLRGRSRLLRVSAFGGASMLLATAAHMAAGGAPPGAGVLSISAFVVGLLALTLTARRCSFWLLGGVLAVEQVVLHEVFATTSMATPSMSIGACPPTSGFNHGAAMAACVATPHEAVAGSGSGMLVAHLLATVATAWLLARGERWLWRLADSIVQAASAAPAFSVRRPRPTRPLPPARLAAAARPADVDARGPPDMRSAVAAR
ncbi:MAG TPA: hypothetical protein VFP34_15330 [Microlunatus sp.]|nr:hypothetical protein [Microlunatus sp.]